MLVDGRLLVFLVSVGKGLVPVGEGLVSVGEGLVSVGEGLVSVGEGLVTVDAVDGEMSFTNTKFKIRMHVFIVIKLQNN